MTLKTALQALSDEGSNSKEKYQRAMEEMRETGESKLIRFIKEIEVEKESHEKTY